MNSAVGKPETSSDDVASSLSCWVWHCPLRPHIMTPAAAVFLGARSLLIPHPLGSLLIRRVRSDELVPAGQYVRGVLRKLWPANGASKTPTSSGLVSWCCC